MLAAFATVVEWFRDLGCPVLVVATSRGVGPVPPDGSCEVVWLDPPATASLTEEVRLHDRMVHRLPDDLRAAVDAFDPERRGLWYTTPFVTTDEPVDGRPVTGGRPASFLALEDKLVADAIWDAAEVERAPYRIVDLADDAALDAATAELGTELGAVWSGDARDGFNGGGDFVRWLRDDRDRAAAAAFFRPRCDRVRVLPFLEGVPCSIHGFVLPDGTAVLRPGRDRHAARPGGAHDGLLRAGQHLGPAGRQTARRCASRRAPRGRAPAARPRLPRRVRHRRRADRRRVPAHRAQHPDVGRRHGAERGGPAVLHLPAGGARGRHGPRAHRGGRRGAGAGDGRGPRRQGRRLRRGHGGGVTRRATRSPGTAGRSLAPRRRPGTCSRSAPPRAGCSPGWTRAPRWCRGGGWRRSTPPSCALLDASYGTSFGPMEPAPDVRTVT